MKQSRFLNIKSLLLSLLLVVTVALAAEVLLTVFSEPARTTSQDNGSYTSAIPTVPARDVHHQLTPFETIQSEGAEWSVNSLGLRGKEVVIPKPPNTYRVLCLGDELLLGANVAEKETLTQKLQTFLQQRTSLSVEVINAGTPGYCPLLSYLQYRHRFGNLAPDLILLFVEPGDVADDHKVRRFARSNGTDIPLACPHPSLLGSKKDKPWWGRLSIVKFFRGKASASTFSSQKVEGETDLDSDSNRFVWLREPNQYETALRHTFAPVASLARLAQQNYSPMIVITLPVPWQFSEETTRDGSLMKRFGITPSTSLPGGKLESYLQKEMSEHKIPILDAGDVLRKDSETETLFAEKGVSYSARGCQVLSQAVGRFIVANVPGVWRLQQN